MSLFYLAELHLKEQNKDYGLLDILNTAIYIRRRMDKIAYDKSRYERRK